MSPAHDGANPVHDGAGRVHDGQSAVSVAPLHSGDPAAIAGYRLAGRLGQGGQGVVYLGYGSGGEKVAVKLLHASFGADPRARTRFAREVDTARRVASYSTAQVLAADIEGSQPYVVSEFIDGPSLLEYVRGHGPQRGEALTRLAIGTLAALLAVHRAGIVHRDFKPANVLLPREGPRVVDFGIARVLENASTLTSQVIGTPAYMAPEQLNGKPVTPATDMFAWGATMAFAATGRAPFGSDSVAAVIAGVLHAEPDLAGVDGPLRPVVAACLAKDPAARPGVRELLARFLDGDPSAATQAGTPAAATAVVPEATLLDAANRAVADLAAAPTATSVPTQGGPARTSPAPDRPASPPDRPAGPSRRGLLIGGGVLVAAAAGGSLAYLLRDDRPLGGDRTRWTHAVGGKEVGQIAATADAVFFASEAGSLQALDATTGKALWTHKGAVSHLVRSGTTLFAVDGTRLRAIDASGGRVRWSVTLSRNPLGADDARLATSGDLVLIATDRFAADGRPEVVLRALSAADGSRRWSAAPARLQGSVADLTLAASPKGIVATTHGSSGGKFYGTVAGLSPGTGEELWHTGLATASGFGATAVVGDTALVGLPDVNGSFHAYDPATGRQRWSAPLVEHGTVSLAADADTVYFCGARRTEPGGSNTAEALYALDRATGKQRWTAQTPTYGETWGPVGNVVLATGKSFNGIWALDTRTGDTVWSVDDMPKPTLLAWNDTTAFLVAGGDDNGDDQTLYALRIAR
ncbi:serine/threonine-protein kinase [Streptomyces sp. TS71-3]|uniref:serine/threonine-protein kinase n=1 Tax=Streptomyces sp. TS71-3 TaxID=2733862 RepID=UPI001B2B1526|nr:serine/threonine-protein kinase [Streptomyces sp. TS71-3]GHJ41107.1 hypothetical protein Sm713_67160 [Streptomyces sp. TS71-3]